MSSNPKSINTRAERSPTIEMSRRQLLDPQPPAPLFLAFPRFPAGLLLPRGQWMSC